MALNKNIDTGRLAENKAAGFLRQKGYKILCANYRTKLGEIDIIAKDKDTLVFVEVKSRQTGRFGLPQEAVSGSKQRQISKVALSYLKENNLFDHKARFDVVSLVSVNNEVVIRLIKNAFELGEGYVI